MQIFNKQKNSTEKTLPAEVKPPENPGILLPEPETLLAASGVKTTKDTAISQGMKLTGTLEGQGNIIFEGKIEGKINCSHQVRIELSGLVTGEIRAKHITINGTVEGQCHAATLIIQAKGSVHGEIFSDDFSIEKGGKFIGQSQLTQQAPAKPAVPPKGAAGKTGGQSQPEAAASPALQP
ncbi:hypothetical protein BIY27_10305 [Gibbsiella quercinecans]|uniref:bactofilin family protein n=1 Tax=Gibbsiella quercinecans TaxID=929813 RepID=UPI000F2DB927|nr:polymer-forming cytoskeletal protein [Gibbsiella quercinecans]RLM13648.1 hypothetical protein BIY27_10305 [Gibbsiella quercinecans]